MKHAEMVALMGRMVLVAKVLERQKDYEKRPDKVVSAWWEEKPLPKPRTGWVVGFRHVQEGYVEPGSAPRQMYDGQVDGGDPDEWRTEKVIPCLLVAFWPTEKPVHVPMDGFLKIAGNRRVRMYLDPEWKVMCRAPEPYTEQGGWSGSNGLQNRANNAKFMREEMKDWPRDEKGRWRKKS